MIRSAIASVHEGMKINAPSTSTSARSTATDEALLERYANGDVRAFEEVYRRNGPTVFRHLRRYLSPGDAEDAMQDIFAKVAGHRWRDRGTPFSHWLSRVTLNTAITYGRKSQTRSRLSEALYETRTVAAPTPPDPILREALESALMEVDPTRREAFTLKVMLGLSHREISARQGSTPAVVSRRIYEARRDLKHRLRFARAACG